MSVTSSLIDNLHLAHKAKDKKAIASAVARINVQASKEHVTGTSKNRFAVALSEHDHEVTFSFPDDQPKASKTTKTTTKPKATPKPKVRKAHPNKGVSVLKLTPEQVKVRDAIYAETKGGAEYHERCAAAGIPTRRTSSAVVTAEVKAEA